LYQGHREVLDPNSREETNMSGHTVLKDVVIGAMSGYAGVQAMTRVTTRLQSMESPQDAEQEKRVSPGVAYTIAAKQLASRVGWELDDGQATQLGSVFHLGLGLAAGEIYLLLRRGFGWGPVLSGLVVASLLWGGVDEGLTPAVGWSAPNSAYPKSTHVRGAVGHLTLGAAVALTAELLAWLRQS
jgi:hypothetical protein